MTSQLPACARMDLPPAVSAVPARAAACVAAVAPVGASGPLAASGPEIGPQTGAGPLRVLVTGSRRWTDAAAIETALLDCWHDALELGAPGIVVVHGAAEGADTDADRWALRHEGQGVGRDPRPADWTGPCPPECRPGHRKRRRDGSEFCPTAGHRRNQAMVDAGAAVALAFQVGQSSGTADCIRRAEAAGIPVRRWSA